MTPVDAEALPQQSEPEGVADSGPESQCEQGGSKRRLPWELLLLPVILLVQSTWMGFLGYLTLRALF